MSAPKHYASRVRQLHTDGLLIGLVITVLAAALVTLAGLLMAEYGARITGCLFIMIGLFTVVLIAALWLIDAVDGREGVPA